MQALNRKLLRDLWRIKGQGLAISMVIGVGVLTYIMYLSTFDSLQATREAYYERQRFADVFASLKRAPLLLGERIRAIPGVSQAETRVVVEVTLDVEGMEEPATGRLISIPEVRREILNDIVLSQGRYVDPGRPDEVIASEGFAQAHGLRPGDSVRAIINGRRRELDIVGVGLSPEFVYVIRAGEMIPDDARFGVFWMGRQALAAAFDMEGGFNDVALSLMPGARSESVIEELDALLRPYGGWGAIPRSLQLSNWSVENELKGLEAVGRIIPVIFLGVAAFLLHVVLRRIVTVQREQIATLKALGYPNRYIGLHYTYWALAISAGGALVGTVAGAGLGRQMLGMYNQYFRFPNIAYHLESEVVAGAIAIAIAAGIFGAMSAVRDAVRLQPAEAMRPKPPSTYRKSLAERIGLQRILSQPARIVLRNIERQPVRSLISIGGIACSLALLIGGVFGLDSMDVMMDTQFELAQRQDLQVTFVEPVSPSGVHALNRLPGVMTAEPVRSAPVRFRSEQRARQLAITGLPSITQLFRVMDVIDLEQMPLPPEGIVMSSSLAKVLEVVPGSPVTVEVLVGRRPVRETVVAAIVHEYMGLSAYMEIDAMRRLVGEGGTLSGGYLKVDTAHLPALFQAIKETPAIAGSTLRRAALDSFNETFAENIGIMIFFNVLFSSIIAFGVVYNAARVSLAERSRELASLRVMGFTRAEISSILLGELGVLTLLALPLGMLLGYGLSLVMVMAFETELYSIPFSANPRTYAWCALSILMATAVSGLLVRRKLDHLDLLEVLKAKE